MSLIIIGKVVAGSLGAGFVALGGFLLHKLLNPTFEIYGFVDVSSAEVSGTIKCHLDTKETESFNCSLSEVTKLSVDAEKKPVLLTEFQGDKNSKPIESKDKLDSTKFYKISISKTDFENKAKGWETKTIKVIQESKTLGTMFAMFVVKDGSVIKKESMPAEHVLGPSGIKSFVGQASKPITETDITEYKCYWQSLNKTNEECKIFSFFDESSPKPDSNNTIDKLTIRASDDVITKKDEIKENHFYLIQFTNDSKKLSEFKTEDLIYAKNPSSGTDSKKVTFSKISAVAKINKQLLILK